MLNAAQSIIRGGVRSLRLGNAWNKRLYEMASKVDPDVRDYLLSKSTEAGPKGYIGQVFYAINGGRDPMVSNAIGLDSSEILMVYRLCDDTVDVPEMTKVDKQLMIEQYWDVFRGRDFEGCNVPQRAAAFLVKDLHRRFFRYDRFAASFQNLMGYLIRNLYIRNKDEALTSAKGVGAYCINTLTLLTDFYEGNLKDSVEEAGKRFGAAAQLLDDLVDAEENMKECIDTYPVLRLMEYADLTRMGLFLHGIDREVIGLALEELREGEAVLGTERERRLYRDLSILLLVRSMASYILRV